MDLQWEINYILDLWKNNPRSATVIVRSKNKILYEKINAIDGKTFSEKSWIFSHPGSNMHCYCGKKLIFLDFKRGYSKFCSTKCTANSAETHQKKVETISKKYGVNHYSQTLEYKTKFEQTCRLRYGVSNPGQILDLKQQRARNKQLTFFNIVIDRCREFSIPRFNFENYTHLRDQNLEWECVQCKTLFQSNLLNKLPKCPSCFPGGNFGGQSSIEKEILNEVKKFYSGKIIENSRDVIAPKELDLYFPEKKFAIELNGVYWHSSLRMDSQYHREKFLSCESQGIQLLMITDYEWKTKRDLVLKMIRHRLLIGGARLSARKCTVQKETAQTVREFFDKNHINGFCGATWHYSLVYENEIVAAVSVSKHRFSRAKNEMEIVRFATGNYIVSGAFGKIFARITQDHPNLNFCSYADLRYGTGKVYVQNKFTIVADTNPGYWYLVNGRLDHRLNWTKKKLVKMGYSAQKTEEQIMLRDILALKIYDCGHRLYRWETKND